MEHFLEIILHVEREAASLEKEAKDSILEIERKYRNSLATLEESCLVETKKKLTDKRGILLKDGQTEAETVEATVAKSVELMTQAARRVSSSAIALVSKTVLLPKEDSH